MGELTPRERATFDQLHAGIRDGLPAFMEGMTALKRIRDNQLYVVEFDTFDQFCNSHGLTSEQVNEWISFRDMIAGEVR